MLPSYIIHNSSCLDRYNLVKTLREKTGAMVFDAILLPNGKDGCRKSHIEVAKLAKLTNPSSRYIVFEDDCELLNGWEKAKEKDADVVYIGLNGICEHTIFGSHALVLSPRARDIIIEHAEECKNEVENPGAFDQILSLLCRKYGLTIWLMDYALQKEGLKSLITGTLRKNFPA